MLRLHINGDLFRDFRTPALGSQGDNRPVKKSCQQTFYHTSIKATFAKYFKKDNKRSEVKCHRLFIYRNILDRTLKHSHVRSEEEHLSAGEIPPPLPKCGNARYSYRAEHGKDTVTCICCSDERTPS